MTDREQCYVNWFLILVYVHSKLQKTLYFGSGLGFIHQIAFKLARDEEVARHIAAWKHIYESSGPTKGVKSCFRSLFIDADPVLLTETPSRGAILLNLTPNGEKLAESLMADLPLICRQILEHELMQALLHHIRINKKSNKERVS